MKVQQLTSKQVTKGALADINHLLKQLRKDDADPTGSLTDLRSITKDKKYVMFVVKDNKRIVGMATLYIIQKVGKRTAVVEDVVVDSEYRGQGLGERLMHVLIAAARAKKINSLFLTSRPARVAAHKLYHKVGFQVKETTVFKMKL